MEKQVAAAVAGNKTRRRRKKPPAVAIELFSKLKVLVALSLLCT